jgi:DNA-binding transcriptional LysR family regulator
VVCRAPSISGFPIGWRSLAYPPYFTAGATLPAVLLQITELPSYQLQDALQTEHIDIALGFGGTLSDIVAAEPLWRDQVSVVVPHDYALAQAEALTFSDIATCPLVL